MIISSKLSLTNKQKLILDFIDIFIKENGFSPSFRNISDNFLITPKGAFDHVLAIEKKGYLKHHKNIARSFVILNEVNYDNT